MPAVVRSLALSPQGESKFDSIQGILVIQLKGRLALSPDIQSIC